MPQRHRLAYGPHPAQFGDLWLPDLASAAPAPVTLLLHGGYWRARYGLDLMDGLGDDLARRGIASWNVEYRRVGDPGGGWPGTLRDVAAAFDYLRAVATHYRLDPARIVPVGHSAGGHLALWLAARHRLAALARADPALAAAVAESAGAATPASVHGAVSLAGVVDLHAAWRRHLSNDAVVGLLGGTPEEVPARYRVASPRALLPLGVPQVQVHGDADEHVPAALSHDYAAAARAAGDDVTLLALPGVEHFAVLDPRSAAWATTLTALQALLDRRPV